MTHLKNADMNAADHRSGFFKYGSWLLLLTAVVMAIGFMGKAYGFGGHRGHNIEAKIERMMDKVDVSDAQRDQIRGVLDAQRPQFRAQRDKMKATRMALMRLDPQTADYDAEVNRLAAEVAQGSQELVMLMASGRKQIWQVLTETQRAKASEMMHKHRQRQFDRVASGGE